jgi:hypothetical protein
MNRYLNLWASVKLDLARARNTLPGNAVSDPLICRFQECIDHNELELACDMLEDYAEVHTVSNDLWLALRDATTEMELPDRAMRYERRISSSESL